MASSQSNAAIIELYGAFKLIFITEVNINLGKHLLFLSTLFSRFIISLFYLGVGNGYAWVSPKVIIYSYMLAGFINRENGLSPDSQTT